MSHERCNKMLSISAFYLGWEFMLFHYQKHLFKNTACICLLNLNNFGRSLQKKGEKRENHKTIPL
jgi:hypothetical protein